MEVIGSGLTLNGLTMGTYGLGVVDQLGCTVDSVVTMNGPDSLTVSVLATMPSCFGDSDGAALAVVEGGTPDYSVVWSGDVEPTIAPSITGLGTGEYTVTATDASGCMADVAFILQEPDPLVLDATTTPVGCTGTDGTLTATVTGGIPLYSTIHRAEGNAEAVSSSRTWPTATTRARPRTPTAARRSGRAREPPAGGGLGHRDRGGLQPRRRGTHG